MRLMRGVEWRRLIVLLYECIFVVGMDMIYDRMNVGRLEVGRIEGFFVCKYGIIELRLEGRREGR